MNAFFRPAAVVLLVAIAEAPFSLAQSPDASSVGQITGNAPGQVLEGSVPPAPNDERAPLGDRSGPGQQQQIPPEQAAIALRLTDVVVVGNTVFPASEFDGLWRQFVGSEVTIGELGNVADDIQTFYRREGFVFTRAILEQTDVASGVATIRVVEGVLGDVNVEESAEPVGPVLNLLEQMADQLEGIRSPHISDLERVLLLMNDVPGIIRATAIPRRSTGGEAGVVNLTINVERKFANGVLFADNRQTPSAGPGLVGISGQYASYSSAADTTTLTYLNSVGSQFDDLQERNIFQIEHSRHVTASGLVVSARGLYSRTDLGDELAAFGIEGQQYEIELSATYPLLRTRPSSIDAFASFTLGEHENDLFGGQTLLTKDSLRVFTVGLDTLDRDSTGFTAAQLGISKGFSFLGGSEEGDSNLSRADADPEAIAIFASLERDQQIFGGLSGNIVFDSQWSSAPQVASREFQGGGTTFGRGFDPSELTGDHGFGVAAELRYTHSLGFLGIPLLESSVGQVYGFYDYARVFNIDKGTPKRAEIGSFGGGVRLELPEDIRLQLEVAKPLEDLDRNSKDNFRIFFEAQKRF